MGPEFWSTSLKGMLDHITLIPTTKHLVVASIERVTAVLLFAARFRSVAELSPEVPAN
jgi:hypothetical protein